MWAPGEPGLPSPWCFSRHLWLTQMGARVWFVGLSQLPTLWFGERVSTLQGQLLPTANCAPWWWGWALSPHLDCWLQFASGCNPEWTCHLSVLISSQGVHGLKWCDVQISTLITNNSNAYVPNEDIIKPMGFVCKAQVGAPGGSVC